ncbi:MAG: NAD(P)H-binding protein [Solibacillus sp.]
MKIAIIGAAGKAGTHLLNEAILRQLDVTAIIKNRANLSVEDVSIIEKDLFHLMKDDLAPFDIIINAFAPLSGEEHLHISAGQHLISLLKGTSKRLFVIGCSGCLFADGGKTTRIMEEEEYPQDLLDTSKAQLQNLQNLKNASIQWTYIIPSAMFDSEGPRTGHYMKGGDQVLVNSQFNSYISYADFAVALLDEIERNEHHNTCFTVVSENVTAAS